MKVTFVFALTSFLLAIYIDQSTAQSHNAIWGYKSPYDKVLVRENVQKSFGFFRVVSEDYEFPPKGHFNYFDISSVRCIDNFIDNDGGSCTLVAGGPGYKFAKLHFKSKRNHGYNFTIEIYGR